MLMKRILHAVGVKAARSGRRDSEEGLRRDRGLEMFERVWQDADLDEEKALRLAVEAQHEGRRP
jgi:hypothetical protein